MTRKNALKKYKVLLIQLGSPASPRVGDVRAYLKDFLGDPRVVDTSPLVWKAILYLFVLPFRPYQSARAYRRIWSDNSGFPLTRITAEFAQKVQHYLPSHISLDHAFLLSSPTLKQVWEQQRGPEKKLIIPLFPQYSESTSASVFDALACVLKKETAIPPLHFVNSFHKSKAFIDNSVLQIDHFLNDKKVDALVISFHGIPKRRVLSKGDPYYRHCYETFFLIRERIRKLPTKDIHMAFQSRFGQEEWLTPYTDAYCEKLVQEGYQKLAVYCPSFVADCLETVDEIGNELQHQLSQGGGQILTIPCLNAKEAWCCDFAKWIESVVESDENNYQLSTGDYASMPEQKLERPPLTKEAKTTLKIVFLTLFLDLIGFSIIFPLFPALAEYYLLVDGENYFLRLIFDSVSDLTAVGENKFSAIVLFGGALGALYSLLQFIAAPLWGIISDRIGRRPVLLISVACLALSYGMWFFAGSFTLLILSRFLGGIMGGNISTATAVVADVTDAKNRSRGMATIGIAFALGFIFGPALGGILSLIDLGKFFPSLVAWGVNPFSMPAALAALLACFNLYYLATKFKETLPREKRGKKREDRSINPLTLFRPLPYKGVNLTNFGHFLFLTAFAGMEFTLTFLAVERLGYTSMDNAYMFIFVGVLIALVQGGYVRRKAHQKGEKAMALMGLAILLPGMVTIAFAHSTWMLYFGLLFLATGSAMAIPTLTSLVSLYTPPEYQGKSIGIFRSLGALARVIGPLAASLIYWKYGPSYPYLIGGIALFLPIAMVSLLPSPPKEHSTA